MIQLTYISTASPGTTPAMVQTILSASRRNNAAANVTGLLLYDGQRFLQALEGTPEAVQAVYERVKVDPRHRAVVLLSRREIEKRAFGDWAMAAQRVALATGTSMPELVDAMTAEVNDLTTQALFRSFARVRSAA